MVHGQIQTALASSPSFQDLPLYLSQPLQEHALLLVALAAIASVCECEYVCVCARTCVEQKTAFAVLASHLVLRQSPVSVSSLCQPC